MVQRTAAFWESCLSHSSHIKREAFHFQPAGREKAFVSVPLEVFIEHMARPGALAAACPSISRRQLLQQSVLAAYVLRACGVACGDRVILLMPHCIEQMVWMLAAKRIGALYVSMPVNISLKASRTRSLPAPSSYGCPPPAFSTLFPNLRLPDLDLCLADLDLLSPSTLTPCCATFTTFSPRATLQPSARPPDLCPSSQALSNRINDCGAKLVLTTTAVSPNGTSLKSMVSRAIAELVPVSVVMDVVQHQLVAAAEAKLGAGRLRLKNAPAELSEALKQSFVSETMVDLQQAERIDKQSPGRRRLPCPRACRIAQALLCRTQVTSKLEMAFSL